MPISGSTVVRRQLGRRLRRLREAAGKTERDVETAKLMSRTKLWRIESGKVPIKVADARTLCWLYGADAPTTDALAALALGTIEQGWWEDYGDAVPDWFGLYIGLEAAASEIRIYDPELVHGLLQTADYAKAVYRAVRPDDSDDVIQRQVELRLGRQRTLSMRTPPPRLTTVLGSAVLARPVGGDQVMAEQTRRLRELAKLDHIDIRVLPWEAGAHAAMHTGAFIIFDFDDPDDPPVVYLEMHTGARYLEKPDELDQYRKIFDLIYEKSVPIEEHAP
ncbi:helix-turn-helix domain-containing protein [Planosporangium sp. 12N6]|uniref:helix-turn-helix domain-containing protein n=1 Tax=Planosporangium spinosum TaxID=3402278 RepID=UPI003CE68647